MENFIGEDSRQQLAADRNKENRHLTVRYASYAVRYPISSVATGSGGSIAMWEKSFMVSLLHKLSLDMQGISPTTSVLRIISIWGLPGTSNMHTHAYTYNINN